MVWQRVDHLSDAESSHSVVDDMVLVENWRSLHFQEAENLQEREAVMPIGAVALIVLALVTGINWYGAAQEQKYEESQIKQRYMVPDDYGAGKKAEFVVLEPEDSKAPAVHPLVDQHGIIPAVGDPFPSKPSIIDLGD
jgi:hypothetical protein